MSGVGSAPAVRAPRGVVVLLAVLTMIGPFTIDTIFPAFPALAADLGVGPGAVQQTVSVYMLTFAVFSLAHGPLSDALGRRVVILAGMSGYALASAVCALAPSLGALLVGRVLQGVVAGAGLVVTRAVARDLFPPHEAQRAMATMSMIFAVAPGVAPVIGGWLLTWTSWRGIFWFLAAYAVLATAVTWFLLPESHPVSARTAFRPGALVASLASASRDPAVLRVCLAIAAGFGAMFLYISSAPAIVAGLLHLGPQDYWVQFLPMVSAMVIGSWAVGRLSGRVSTRGLIALGLLVLALGAAVQLVLTAGFHVSTLPGVLVGMTLASFGVAVVFPVATVALLDLRPAQRGTVSSLQSALSNAGNAVVSGALSPLVSGSFVGLGVASAALVVVAGALWALQLRFTGPVGPSTSAAAAGGG